MTDVLLTCAAAGTGALVLLLAIALALPARGRSPRPPAETPLDWAHRRFVETWDDDCVEAVLALERHVEAIDRGEDPRPRERLRRSAYDVHPAQVGLAQSYDGWRAGIEWQTAAPRLGGEHVRVREVARAIASGDPERAMATACVLSGLSGTSVSVDRRVADAGLLVRWRDRAVWVPCLEVAPPLHAAREAYARMMLRAAEELARPVPTRPDPTVGVPY